MQEPRQPHPKDRSEDTPSILPWPFGPTLEPDLSAAGSEPRETPPADADFGEGPCGAAATRLWAEHRDGPFARLLGPSLGHYQHLQDRADRCQRVSHPSFSGPCAGEAREVFAYAWILGESPEEAERRARLVERVCAAVRRPLLDALRDTGIGGP